MSGICAVWRKGNPRHLAETLASMTAGLLLESSERAGQETEGDAGLGVSARFSGQQIHRGSHVLLACDAELLNEKELASMAGASGLTTAALLAALYERSGTAFVEKLRAQGDEIRVEGPDSFLALQKSELEKWKIVIDKAGIVLN